MTAKLRSGLAAKQVTEAVNDLIDRVDALYALVAGDGVVNHPVVADIAAEAAQSEPEPVVPAAAPDEPVKKTVRKKPTAPNTISEDNA